MNNENAPKGLLHLYIGGGKGKTTAAAGLCCRMLSSGGRVLYAQFLKSGTSSEVPALQKLGAHTMHTNQSGKFTWKMDQQEAQLCRQSCQEQLAFCTQAAAQHRYDLMVLDEVLDAAQKGFLPWEDVTALARSHGETELVFTGRDALEEIKNLADYISFIKAEKHPYTKGVAARKGIEY